MKNEKVWSIIDKYENKEIGFEQAIDLFADLNNNNIDETIADLELMIGGVLTEDSRGNVIQHMGNKIEKDKALKKISCAYKAKEMTCEQAVIEVLKVSYWEIDIAFKNIQSMLKRDLTEEEKSKVSKIIYEFLKKQTVERELELDCSDCDDLVSCEGSLEITLLDLAEHYEARILELRPFIDEVPYEEGMCYAMSCVWDYADSWIDEEFDNDDDILDAFGDRDTFIDDHGYWESDAKYDAMCDAADEEIDRRQEEDW